MSPRHAQGSIDPAPLQSYLEVPFLCTAGARAKRPRIDGFKAAATEPLTTADVTQGKDCRSHPKLSWQEEPTADPVATIWRELVANPLVARGVAKAIAKIRGGRSSTLRE